MKHPTQEELISWVYGEAVSPRAKHIRAHLSACADCRARVEAWRGTMRALDDLPAPVARKRFDWAPVQWAAAAALFVGLGIVLGRFAISTDEAKLRAALDREIARQVAAVRQELTQDFAATLEQARSEDRAAYLAALDSVNQNYQAQVNALKTGLETIVAVADYGFEATGHRLAQLAAATSNPSQE